MREGPVASRATRFSRIAAPGRRLENGRVVARRRTAYGRTVPVVSERTIDLPCNGLRLDGRLAVPGGAKLGCVVCHPHPLYGGNMDNPVVAAAVAALGRAGIATLRFDFRGTRLSEGLHSGGPEEVNDATAAVEALECVAGIEAVAVAGYSFGAAIAMRVGARTPRVAAVATIAPPLAMFDFQSVGPLAMPLLVVAGDGDPYCPPAALERFCRARPSARTRILHAADHFLAGRETDAAAFVAAFVAAAPVADTVRR